MRELIFIIVLFASLLPCFSADLKTYKETYDKNSGDIITEFGMNLVSLADSYIANLKKLQETAQKTGDFEKTKTIISEIERFSKDKTLSEDTAKTGLLEIKKTQLSYIKERSALELSKDRRISTLSEQYEKALGVLLADLTKQGKLDEAASVHAERQRVQNSQQILLAKNKLQEVSPLHDKKEEPSMPPTNQETIAKLQPDRIKLSKTSELEDPAGDLLDAKIAGPGLDLCKVSIQRKVPSIIVIEFQTEAKIPAKFKTPTRFLMSLEFITEKEEKDKAEKGFDPDLNVRIYFDPKAGQWKTALDSMSPVTATTPLSVRSFNVSGNKATIEFKGKFFESLSSIRYWALTHTMSKEVDRVPDRGFEVLKLIEQK